MAHIAGVLFRLLGRVPRRPGVPQVTTQATPGRNGSVDITVICQRSVAPIAQGRLRCVGLEVPRRRFKVVTGGARCFAPLFVKGFSRELSWNGAELLRDVGPEEDRNIGSDEGAIASDIAHHY